MTNKNKPINPWANLVVAMLAVNQYPLEKTFKIFDQLEENGLFDPHNFASWSIEELFKRLIASNYDRGRMNRIFADRLQTIGCLVDDLNKNEQILLSGTEQDIISLLKRVKGIGPVVIKNFMLLRAT